MKDIAELVLAADQKLRRLRDLITTPGQQTRETLDALAELSAIVHEAMGIAALAKIREDNRRAWE